MKISFIKTALICVGCILSLGTSFAAQKSNQEIEKTYILKITSPNPNLSVPLMGSFMEMKNGSTYIQDLGKSKTPYKITVKTIALSTMIMSSNEINVEILEKMDNQNKPVLSATGHNIVSFNDSSGQTQFIYARQ